MFKSLKIGHLTTPVISHEISSSFMFHVSRCSLAITTTVIPNLPLQQCSYHITLATKGKSILKSLRSLYIHGTGDCWKIRGFEEKNETTASDYTKSPSKRSGKSRCLISKSTGKPSANWTFSVAMFSNLYKKKNGWTGAKRKSASWTNWATTAFGEKDAKMYQKKYQNRQVYESRPAIGFLIGSRRLNFGRKIFLEISPKKTHFTNIHDEWMGRSRE